MTIAANGIAGDTQFSGDGPLAHALHAVQMPNLFIQVDIDHFLSLLSL